MRYGNYVRFYQSLDPSQYERLTRIDKYIDQQYLLDLLSDYGQHCDEKQYQGLAQKLQASGVNMERQQSFQRAYEQSMRQQYEAQVAAQQQQQEEEASVSLDEAMGN